MKYNDLLRENKRLKATLVMTSKNVDINWYEHQMRCLATNGDLAAVNQNRADQILCEVLTELGFDDLIAIYDRVAKVYLSR